MIGQLFLNLIFAHVVGDFYCQTHKFIKEKRKLKLKSLKLYLHIIIIFLLSWISVWSWTFWWAALIIGMSHLIIDTLKSVVECCKPSGQPIYKTQYAVWPFVIDQLLHIVIIAVVAGSWLQYNDWSQHEWIKLLGTHYQLLALALLVSWRPANIFVANILQSCQVNFVDENNVRLANFKLGALIGTLERWLIIFFMSVQQYEAIGILVAVKSIRGFGVNRENEKSEYVLAGTILSISIGIAAGLLLLI